MLSLFQRRVVALTALLLAFCATTIQAQASTAQSTFFLEQTQTQFSINLANDSTDVNIFFTSPAYSWVGVGFGEGMKNSLMIIMYPNEKGDNVTISPRIGTGHSEPSYAPGIEMDILDGTGITDDDMFVLKAVCRSCRVWPGGFIDANNSARPMIYAFGPGSNVQSNDLNAGLHRHHVFGTFTMNMVAATGKGEVPANSTALNGVDLGPMHRDHDRANLAHAVMGCIALFVIWPLNLLLAGFLRNIRIHVGVSIFLMVFLVISYALGISTSSEYNRSKNFTSPHQIVAFISILPILLMSLLPIKRIAAMHTLIPRLHTSLTTTTYVALVLTGGLGLHLYTAPMPIITSYVAISLLVFVFLTLITFCVKRRGSAYARATTRRRLGEEDEADFGLAQYHAQRKLDEESSRSTSAASLHPQGHVQPQGWSHVRSPSGGEQWRGNVYGGGSMPGPRYLLNMHPGVPVHFK